MELDTSGDQFKNQLFAWANQFEVCCFLDSCHFLTEHHAAGFGYYDFILAVDPVKEIKTNSDGFKKLKEFYEKFSGPSTSHWLFGYFSYDLKNELEKLNSHNEDQINFPALHFFVPKIIVLSRQGIVDVVIHENYKNEITKSDILRQISECKLNSTTGNYLFEKESLNIKITKDQYLNTVEKIKHKIFNGDVYEMNYCFEMFQNGSEIRVSDVYRNIIYNSPSPFSCFYSLDNKYLMSASMERFLTQRNKRVFSQPIKGTAQRSGNVEQDNMLKNQLKDSTKERAENIMIVDLVRNDLSKIAKRGTVRVDELCKIYSFSHVHQMISTISCEMKDKLTWIDAIKACFPMGSMTGAPKINAMKFIEEYENTKRGLYSGAVGYVDPYGNFDFNVVIRALQYNAENHYLSLMVGSAITAKSDAGYEYEECMLKAKALQQALQSTQKTEA